MDTKGILEDWKNIGDDEFFGRLEKGRQNLRQLFDEDAPDGDGQLLKYQAPKKEQRNVDVSKVPGAVQWTTKIAKVGVAYKQRDTSVGKVGIAFLVQTENLQSRRLIVYKTKNNILANTALNGASMQQLHLQSNYLQFYDDDKMFWSVRFDKDSDLREFLHVLETHDIKINKTESEESITTSEEGSRNDDESSPAAGIEAAPAMSPALSSSVSGKPSIISRMAKMGGQPLPILHQRTENVTTEYSDSSDTEVIVTSKAPPIMPRSSKLQAKTQLMPSVTTTTIANTAGGFLNHMETNLVQMMLTENRTQNTELRMNIGKLETKIEKILDKVDSLNTVNNNARVNKEDEVLELEEKLLDLKKENRKLRQALQSQAKEFSMESFGATARDPSGAFGKALAEFEDELKACGIRIDHNTDLRMVLTTLLEKLKSLKDLMKSKDAQLIVETEKQKILEHRIKQEGDKSANVAQELHESTLKLEKLHSENENLKSANSDLSARISSRETETSDLSQRLEALKRENKNLQETLSQQKKDHERDSTAKRTVTENTVKEIMNNLYGTLTEKIGAMGLQGEEKIVALIGRTIREETLRSIKRISTD